MKKSVTLEEVSKKLDEVLQRHQRQELQLARLEAKIAGEPVGDDPITRAEVDTRMQISRLASQIVQMRDDGLL